jgi:hypothetical protein
LGVELTEDLILSHILVKDDFISAGVLFSGLGSLESIVIFGIPFSAQTF